METGFTRDEGAVRWRWQTIAVSLTWKEGETSKYVVHHNIDELPKSFLKRRVSGRRRPACWVYLVDAPSSPHALHTS